MVELEPLSANDAIHYISEDEISRRVDPDAMVVGGMDLARFVVKAGMVEMSLYLQIARELNSLGELRLDVDGERLALRTGLLERWIECRTAREVELPKDETKRAMEGLERFACLLWAYSGH